MPDAQMLASPDGINQADIQELPWGFIENPTLDFSGDSGVLQVPVYDGPPIEHDIT